MPRRFEQYKITRGDNLGDPEFWNRRFEDLDLRLAARELDGDRINTAVDQLTMVALARLNDTFTPLILEAQTRLANFGVGFSAASASSVAIGTGAKTFVLTPETREAYVFIDYVSLRVAGDETKAMIGQVLTYDRDTGALEVDSVLADGAGTYDDWIVTPSLRPDLTHATRTDNPHHTTATQVGAYSVAAVDTMIDAIENALDLLAPKRSPAFEDAPTAPTVAGTTDSSEKVSTTAFVQAVVATIRSDLALKAPLASPPLTGTPTAPTASATTNTGQLATAAFVHATARPPNGTMTAPNAVTPNTKVDIGTGVVRDDTDAVYMPVASPLTINCLTVGANGLDAGALANGLWYYPFVIMKADGTIASLASLSPISPTMPSGYIYKKRRGAFVVDGLTHIVPWKQQGNRFQWPIPVPDVNVVQPGGGAAVLYPLSVPNGLSVDADVTLAAFFSTAGAYVYFSSPDMTDVVPSISCFTLTVSPTVNFAQTAERIRTNPSRQIRARVEVGASTYISILTKGWYDAAL